MPPRAIWFALWVAMTTLVSVLYLLPDAGPPGAYQIDKLAHLIAFAAIGVATWPASQQRSRFGCLLAIGCVLAVGLECLQALVPARQWSLFDVLANLTGLTLGTIAGWRFDDVLTRLVEVGRAR
jgi:VanZ family protein